MPLSITAVVLTYRRDDILESTFSTIARAFDGDADFQVVFVDNNADGVDRSGLLARFSKHVYAPVRQNLGVAGGRNHAMFWATGDIVLFLDDDAHLDGGPGLGDRLRQAFDADGSLGTIAFRSFVGEKKTEDPAEFPHTDKGRSREKAFKTFRFIGVAHAVRRSALDAAGRYCESFFYGMEEFDMSYRLLKRGWGIEYRPEFAVRHMKAETGRLPSKAVLRRMYANKLAVCWMHMPFRYLVATGCAWFVKTAIDGRSAVLPFRAVGDFLAAAAQGRLVRREPSEPLVAAIRALGGQAWK
jgi:GT2 family glycosyltransferase